jgi:hypothetical protein
MRISRTALPHLLHVEAYETYPAGRLSALPTPSFPAEALSLLSIRTYNRRNREVGQRREGVGRARSSDEAE